MMKNELGDHPGFICLFPTDFGGRKATPPDSLPWRPILQSESGECKMAEITGYSLDELAAKRTSTCWVKVARSLDQSKGLQTFFIREDRIIGSLIVDFGIAVDK